METTRRWSKRSEYKMSENSRKKGQDFAKWLQSRSKEEREEGNRKGREQAETDHKEFQEAFRAGKCFACKDDLTSFHKDRPCVHWLLKPNGFTKWHFPDVANKFSCSQIQAFLRWVASEEAFARNINDLSDEGTGKLIELTIRYKDCEWSISCGENDFLGHQTNSENSKRPHYHFQMRYNRGAFIRSTTSTSR